LSFLHAERSKKSSYHLAAAIYAFAFLFPEEPAAPPDPFDPRPRGDGSLIAASRRHSSRRTVSMLGFGRHLRPSGRSRLPSTRPAFAGPVGASRIWPPSPN
jgi:hypothetical protein